MVAVTELRTPELERLAESAHLELMKRRNTDVGQQMRDERAGQLESMLKSASMTTATIEKLTLTNIEDAMTYQPWNDKRQHEAGDIVREVLLAAAKAILRVVPDSPRRTTALNAIINARMDCNAAISFKGRF